MELEVLEVQFSPLLLLRRVPLQAFSRHVEKGARQGKELVVSGLRPGEHEICIGEHFLARPVEHFLLRHDGCLRSLARHGAVESAVLSHQQSQDLPDPPCQGHRRVSRRGSPDQRPKAAGRLAVKHQGDLFQRRAKGRPSKKSDRMRPNLFIPPPQDRLVVSTVQIPLDPLQSVAPLDKHPDDADDPSLAERSHRADQMLVRSHPGALAENETECLLQRLLKDGMLFESLDDAEGGVDAGLHGVLVKESGTEGVNGADEGAGELLAKLLQPSRGGRVVGGDEGLRQLCRDFALELAGGLVRKREGDNVADFRLPAEENLQVAFDQNPGLPRPGVRPYAEVPVTCEGIELARREHRGGQREWPVSRTSASSYFRAVVLTICSGSRGAGGFLSHRMERR